jgi:hypothetical protein
MKYYSKLFCTQHLLFMMFNSKFYYYRPSQNQLELTHRGLQTYQVIVHTLQTNIHTNTLLYILDTIHWLILTVVSQFITVYKIVNSTVCFMQVKAASYALSRNCSVVICNGCEENAIVNIVKGKKVGTFFTKAQTRGIPVDLQAKLGNLSC